MYGINKKYVDVCSSSTDYLIVKEYVDACTTTDDVCTNENEPCTNEPCSNENEQCTNEPCSNENELCTNENEPCTNENELCTNENEPCSNENEPCTNKNEPCTNEPCSNENDDDDDEDGDEDDDDEDDDDGDGDDDNNIDIGILQNFSDKVLNKLIIVSETRKEILNNIKKILAVVDKANNISRNDLRLKLDEYKKSNILVDDLINVIWVLMYGKNRVNNEINNINADKEKDVNGYVNK